MNFVPHYSDIDFERSRNPDRWHPDRDSDITELSQSVTQILVDSCAEDDLGAIRTTAGSTRPYYIVRQASVVRAVPPAAESVLDRYEAGYLTDLRATLNSAFTAAIGAAGVGTTVLRTFGANLRDTDCTFVYAVCDSNNMVASACKPPVSECDPSWLDVSYTYGEKGQISEALRALYWGVEDLLEGRQYDALNRILAGFNVSRTPVEVMIGMIRVTFRARTLLPAWPFALKRIRTEINRLDVPNANRLLVGLPA